MKLKELLIMACICLAPVANAQNALSEASSEKEMEKARNNPGMTQVAGNTYLMAGKGGNVAVHFGAEEILIIDDKFEDMTDHILEQVRRINADKPISFLINTHHHGDHTGGNENMAKEGATIIAHENVRKNMRVQSGTKEISLPQITFNKDMKIWFDGQEVYAFHVDNAHTNGDVMVYLPQTNVLHTGDAFVNSLYPYIDIENGGTLDGYIQGLKQAMMVVDKNTKIIPGHGKIGKPADLKLLANMLETLKKRISAEISRDKTEEEVAADTDITQFFDDKGYGDGFIDGEKIRRTIYQQLTNPYTSDEERLRDRKMKLRNKAEKEKN